MIYTAENYYLFKISQTRTLSLQKLIVSPFFGGITALVAIALVCNIVDKLLLSDDNRFNRYNEPDAAVNYLANFKAMFNIYVRGEDAVLGLPIKI